MNAALERPDFARRQEPGGWDLKVDGFINHQVDPVVDGRLRAGICAAFRGGGRDPRFLTAEISGIAPAVMAARY
jgi:adenine/guanine phosphoribosyltransferase-like PRPP-binding protein